MIEGNFSIQKKIFDELPLSSIDLYSVPAETEEMRRLVSISAQRK